MDSICEICGKQFIQGKKHKVRTCSTECGKRLRAKKMAESYAAQGTWITTSCANRECGKEFNHRRSKPQRFCSHECYTRMTHEAAVVSRTCIECGKGMTSFKRQDQQFCSVTCRNRHTAAKRSINYPTCRICGVSTDSYNRVFCDAHRPKPGKQPLPRKMAICVGCGEEFSRPGSWPGQMKYCSNACSHRETKSVRDKFVLELNSKAVVFHSEWEMRFWIACRKYQIPIRRYDGPDIQTSVGVYRPDFIISPHADEDITVDVKGYLRPESQIKTDESDVMLVDRPRLELFESTGKLLN